jgi:hypothetical protein
MVIAIVLWAAVKERVRQSVVWHEKPGNNRENVRLPERIVGTRSRKVGKYS